MLELLLFGSKLSPLVLHLRHVCCCSYRNHLLFSGAKLGKVGENDKRAVWYCPEWLVIITIIIFCESEVNFTTDNGNNKSSFIKMHNYDELESSRSCVIRTYTKHKPLTSKICM